MSIALFENRPLRAALMRGEDAMPDATLRECLQRPFRLYARARGRASRKEIWVFNIWCAFMSGILGGLFHSGALAVIPLLWGLACIIPSIALEIRRLHDLLLPGWLLAVPYLFEILAIILLANTLMAMLEGDDPMGSMAPGMFMLLAGMVCQLFILCWPSRYKPAQYPNNQAMPNNQASQWGGQPR